MPGPTEFAPIQTYSLPEAARILCGTDSTGAQKWLTERLKGNAQPHLPGYKSQRKWRMTQHDLDKSVDLLRPRLTVPSMTSMTARSQRRLAV